MPLTHTPIAGLRKKIDATSGALVDIVDQNGDSLGVVSGGGKSRRVPRVFFSRMGTLDNSTLKTFNVGAEAAQHFDAISPILATTSATSSSYWLVKVSVASAWGDGNNSAGTWVQAVNDGNDTAFPLKLAGPGGERTSYTVTRPVALRSVARSDGGTMPLVFIRAYSLDTNASMPCYGNGTGDAGNDDNLLAWASRTTGRRWAARQQNGDQLTTPSGFTSTTDVSQSPIVGFVYWSRGAVVGLAGCGDSLNNGQGTVTGEGWAIPLADQLAAQLGIPVEYSNFAWAGQEGVNTTTGSGFYQRALDILRDENVRPDMLMIPCGSFNPISAPLLQAHVDKQSTILRRVLSEASTKGTRVMLYTWSPITTAGAAYGTSDALRVAYNAEILAGYPNSAAGARGIGVADFSAAISGDTVGGMVQIRAGLTDDTIHPNDAGNALFTATALPVAKQVIAGVL